MNAIGDARSRERSKCIRIHPRLAFSLTVVVLMLVSGCNFGAQTDTSLEETKIALGVEATSLALQSQQLTQDALSQAAQPTTPPTQPPPPTQAVQPTQPPAPTEAPTTAPTTAPTQEVPSGPEPVQGSLIRADYDPAAGWGQGHDSDDFDGSDGLFPGRSDGASRSWYGDGQYHIAFSSRGRWTWYWSFLDTGNFYTDVVVINGDKCVDRDTAGMLFRGNSVADYGYMFGISCGGEYYIGITSWPGAGGSICSIIDGSKIDCGYSKLISNEVIDTGPGAMNRIGIYATGGDFNFYINGQWVDGFNMYALPTGFQSTRGNIALYLGTAQKPNAKVNFEDFNIWYNP